MPRNIVVNGNLQPIFLLGEFHGQRTLAGRSPWGCKDSDTTEQLTHCCELNEVVKEKFLVFYLMYRICSVKGG